MNDSTNPPPASESGSGEPVTGKRLREARLAANIDITKICSDLRLSASVIEALEKGDYHLLSGDPYIRALLGSIGRYLNLDVTSLIAGYNKDIGAVQSAPSISPYKDREHTYTTAHKQIFVIVFLALFVGLILLIGKINKGEPEASNQSQAMNPAPVESLAIPQDTGLESHSLAPDSELVKSPAETGETPIVKTVPETGKDPGKSQPISVQDKAIPAPPQSAEVKPPVVTSPVKAPGNPVPTSPIPGSATPGGATPGAVTPAGAMPAVGAQGSATPVAAAPLTLAIIKPLIDSVGVKVQRTGKEDFLTVLRMGKQMQVSNQDTIVVMISKRKSVEVTLGDKSVIPNKKRFKIYGTTLRTF